MSELDMIGTNELAERLRASRSSAGMTQGQAANSLGMARTTLVAIERGQRRIRPTELLALSALYNVSTNHLLRPTAINVDLATRFRRNSSSSASTRSTVEAVRLLSDLVAASVELERLLDKPLRPHYPPEYEIRPGDIEQQAEDAALALRSHLGLGLNPIPDIVSVAELELSIRVFVRPLDSSISGVFGHSPEAGAAILVNAKHPRQRRALTIAHECGHFLCSRDSVDVYCEEQTSSNREEKFSNSFGPSLLMPPPAIRRRFSEISGSESRFSPRHLILMAHSFHVSLEGMCRTLERLKLLPKGTFELLKERGLSGESVREVLGDPAPESDLAAPPRLALLAAEAYDAELLSEGQISEMLRQDRVDVRRWLDALGGAGEEIAAISP